MGILQKIANWGKQKGLVISSSFDGLRMFGNNAGWSKTTQMSKYTTSLYVHASVRKIAEKVGASDIQLFEILNSKGETRQVFNHEILDLLYRVNPFQTKSEFLETLEINLKLSGDAFVWKNRNESGKVQELWNLRPDKVIIVTDPELYIKGYEFQRADGTTVKFVPEDIIHFKYPNPLDEFYGLSPVTPAQTRIQTEEFASHYQRDFFINNARPDAILSFESELTPKEKENTRKEWDKRHRGNGKNSKVAILENGVTYHQLSMSQKDMDYIDSMKFTRDDILVAFGVPKPIVAVTDDVNRANAETAMHIFLSETIYPELKRLEEKFNEQLIITEFSDKYFIVFPDPTPEDREQKIKEYEAGLKNGYMLINEVRSQENLPPVDGGWSLYKPLNEVPVGELDKKNQTQKTYEDTFVGKGMVKMKIKLEEDIKEEVYAQLKGKKIDKKSKKHAKIKTVKEKCEDCKPKEEKKETKAVPLIKDADLKEQYAENINKRIDRRADGIAEKMTDQAIIQRDKFVALLSSFDIDKSVKEKVETPDSIIGKIKDFFKAEDEIMAEFMFPYIDDIVKESGMEALVLVNNEGTFEKSAKLQETIEKRAKDFGKEINDTTAKKLGKTLGEGITEGEGIADLTNRVNKVYKEYPDYRSELIARTETTNANNLGFLDGYEQSGVATHKEWIATLDDRTRAQHMELNGDIVKLDEEFSNGLMYPQEPNCRCVIGPAFES